MAITLEEIQTLDFGSNSKAGTSFRSLTTTTNDVGMALRFAVEESATKGLRLARGILSTAPDVDQAAAELGSMVAAAATGSAVERTTVARAARLSAGGVLFIDRVSRLPADQAAPMVSAYFESGGSMGDVTTWLQTVGAVLRRSRSDGNMGGIIDWISDAAEDVVDALGEAVETIVGAIEDLAEAIADAVNWTVDQLADLAAALLEAGATVADILVAAAEETLAFVIDMGEALIELGEDLVEILDELVDVAVSAIQAVVEFAVNAGRAIVDVLEWMATATVAAVRQAVRGLIDAAGALVTLVIDVAQLGLQMMQVLVNALLEIGETLVGLAVQFAEMALDALEVFLEAAIQLGLAVAELVGELIVMTYDAVANLVTAALRAGITVLELVGDVVSTTYWGFRRIINGVIAGLGPVGEILDAVLDNLEDVAGDAWRWTLNALRFAEANLSEALDWAREQGVAVMEAVLQAWENIGEDLLDAYRWAKDVAVATGDAIFRLVGEVTFRLGNSVSYVLGYLEDDFLEGVEDFAHGLLDAGYTIADLLSRVVERSIEVVAAAFRAALAVGHTLADLLLEIVAEPDRIMEHVLSARDEMNQTLTDLMGAVDAAGDRLAEDVMRALRNLGTSVQEMVGAIFEIGGGLIGVAISALLATVGSYRELTDDEKELAELVFADSLDLERIYISQDDWVNELIFWVQDGFGEDPGSRAFVTFNLINFDVDDVLTDATLIHELTHVWQATIEGPFYMAEALHAQLEEELGGPDAYNYGYTNSTNGDGGDTALENGTWDDFNPEQQGNIIEHYFVRRYEEERDPAEYAAWEPYVQHVQAGVA